MQDKTAENLLVLVEKRVSNNEPISPAQWLEYAMRINAMTGERIG